MKDDRYVNAMRCMLLIPILVQMGTASAQVFKNDSSQISVSLFAQLSGTNDVVETFGKVGDGYYKSQASDYPQ